MGYALAEAAIEFGASVNLVSGPVSLNADKSINLHKINSADDNPSQLILSALPLDLSKYREIY